MADRRKLQGEIDRCHKKVQEGVEIFEDIWQKAHNAPNINQKEKYEADLKKEIKKLQRLRDQIKTWIASSEIKDKRSLVDDRKLIETQMERFKVLERETKTKAYSKEGLGAAQKLDPVQREKEDLCNWMTNSIESLNIQIDQFESEIESLSVHLRKKKNDKDKQERVDKLKSSVDKHKYHINQLETLMRMLDNSTVDVHQVKGIKDDVEYYIESSQEPDFEENEYIYDDLELEDISEFLNKSKMNSTTSTTGSANNSTTQKEPGAPTTTGVCTGTTTTATITTTVNTSTLSQTSLSQEALHTSTLGLGVQSSLNNGVCKPEEESHTTSVQSTGPKGTPCDSPTPSPLPDFNDSVSTASVCLQMNGPVVNDCNHISDKITTNGAPHLVNHSTSNSSNSSMNFAISSLSNTVATSSSVTNSSDGSGGSGSGGSYSSTSITISTSKLVWSGVTSNSSVSTVCTNNSNNSQCSPPLDPSAGLLYASAAAAVKHSDQLPAAAGVAFSQAQTSTTNVNQQQQLQQQLHQQLHQQQQLQQLQQQQQQNQLHHQQLNQQLQAIGSQSASSTSSSTTSNGEQQQFTTSSAASGLYSQAATSNGGWNRVTQPNGPLNRLPEEQQPSMSSLKTIAQQAVMSAGLAANQLDQTAVTASAVSPSLHAQFSSVAGSAASGSLASLSNSQASQQMLNLINAGAAAAAAAAASISSKPMSMLLGSGGTSISSGVQQSSEAHIPPLLGVAPLGPVQLPKPCIYQLHMLEAACRHVIHPLDSQRARSYLPSGSVPSPSFYPQQALPHSDTLDFFHRLSTETLFFIFYFMEGTKAQFLAAKALKKQSWRFHTKFMMWFQRHEEPKTITDEYEQGTYIYFDYEKWGQRKREHFTFEYRYLEDRELN